MKELKKFNLQFFGEDGEDDIISLKKSELELLKTNKFAEGARKAEKSILEKYQLSSLEDLDKVKQSAEQFKTQLKEKDNAITGIIKEKETLQEELNQLKKQSQYGEISIKLISEGFNPERLETIKPLILGDEDMDSKIEKIKTNLPELFAKDKKFINPNYNPDRQRDKTEAELYIEQKRKLLNK